MADEVVLPGTATAPVIPAVAQTTPDPAADQAAKDAAAKAAADTAAAEAAAKQPIAFTMDTKPTPTPSTSQVVVYEKTGDAGLDVALQYVGERGFGPDHPAIVAATKGDFAILEAELAKLGDKAPGSKAFVELAKQSYERKQESVKSAESATAKVVHDAVGGPENWAAIKEWATANADPDEKRQLNAAFAAGGFAAQAAAEKLAQLYQRQGGKPKSVVKANATPVSNSGGGPLDPKAYGREVAALHAKLGNKMEGSQEYQSLVSRFRAYRG
jgi:hypothetical protein